MDKKLVQTLTSGKASAMRLQDVLRRKLHHSVSVHHLLMKITQSFSRGLLVLNSSAQVPVNPPHALACSGERLPEVYTGKKAVKKRRGCYKRRNSIDSRIGTIEDGYSWRKYGQKQILNSKFPRLYFRCKYKHVYGCKALKQAQKLEDESNRFSITYFGHHTCSFSQKHHYLPSSPSTITNIHINPLLKPENPPSDPPLAWKEILDDELDLFKMDGFSNTISFDDIFFT